MNLKDIKGSNNMAINLNDVKNMSKDEKSNKIKNAHKNAVKASNTEQYAAKKKILYDLCEFYETACRFYVDRMILSDLNIDCTKEKKNEIKNRKGDEIKINRRKCVYDCFIAGNCTMKQILDTINTKAFDVYDSITKDNYTHVWNRIREKKGRKDDKGNVRGINMKFDDKGVLKECKASERLNKAIAFGDFDWK